RNLRVSSRISGRCKITVAAVRWLGATGTTGPGSVCAPNGRTRRPVSSQDLAMSQNVTLWAKITLQKYKEKQ
ncbi:MAG TPA: hypothetical protein VJY33_25450, partial [Isosphaeraceae bacterium]|nr:hypothetical protein [Isosphaeraceae bacterium]